jgi:hypothetical protein
LFVDNKEIFRFSVEQTGYLAYTLEFFPPAKSPSPSQNNTQVGAGPTKPHLNSIA